MRTWPGDWESRKRGDSCHFCADLSHRSFHSGRASEAILERNAIANGHAAVVFRGRHVADFTRLSANELADYWRDIQDVGRIIERVFQPCHMNYMLNVRASKRVRVSERNRTKTTAPHTAAEAATMMATRCRGSSDASRIT